MHVTDVQDGVYVHANNCTSSILLPHNDGRPPLCCSEGRRVSLQMAIQRRAGAIHSDVCRQFLGEASGRPKPDWRPLDPTKPPLLSPPLTPLGTTKPSTSVTIRSTSHFNTQHL